MRLIRGRHVRLGIAIGLLACAPAGASAVAQTPGVNGRIAFTHAVPGNGEHGGNVDVHTEIYTMAADGTRQKRLTTAPRNRYAPLSSYDPSFSSDGSKIAFTSDRHDGWADDVYVMNADGTNQTRLSSASDAYADAQPSFSPDGSKILFVSSRRGHLGIYLMNVDGTHPTALTSADRADAYDPSFSPDGSKIAFATDQGIWVMHADGTERQQLTTNQESEDGDGDVVDAEPSFSPDGAKIVFTSGFGVYRPFVMNADGTGRTALTGSQILGESPMFSPDGTRVVYADENDGAQPVGAFLRVLDLASDHSVRVPGTAPHHRAQVGNLSPSWGTVPSPAAAPLTSRTSERRVHIPSTAVVQKAVVRSRAARKIRFVAASCTKTAARRWSCEVGRRGDPGEDDPASYRSTVTYSAAKGIHVGRLRA